jgi:hypothetical protein
MGKVRDLYDNRVRPMVPAERLQLAKLILDDLATSDQAVDVSDEWSEDDLAELAAHSARHGERVHADAAITGVGDGRESR